MKGTRSLFVRYSLIVLCAILLLPLTFPIVTIVLSLPFSARSETSNPYRDGSKLTAMWHREAKALSNAKDADIDAALQRLKARYPEAGMFWVDAGGRTRLYLSDLDPPPDVWPPSYAVSFMKARIGGDPFTVVAFVGDRDNGAFMVFEVPRGVMKAPGERVREQYPYVLVGSALLVLGLFLSVSLMFFYRLRCRLVRLERAMTPAPDADGDIPAQIEPGRQDEIGRLETAFNDMVRKLEDSRRREAGEELLRRDLIANLSHDLRTPLTAINGHVYGLRNESLSARGRESVALVEQKIGYLGQLIDNLLSHALLSAGRYPYHPDVVDIVRTVRTLLAGWYPAFEREGFEIDADFPDNAVCWTIDAAWLERVLDNYFQNALRHAKSGYYIGLRVEERDGGAIVIADRGPGLVGVSTDKGAGLGLSIASLMLKEMNLCADIVSGDPASGSPGTTIRIRQLEALPPSE
ncbi:HAMP domain-containing sensor histidine kinase [Cohnella sp. GbtcB17]|uniref:HAMP domain-containing sensor histidine kinase n=1 Tax=Cohnella sp. GbtcB17 TaxID=2824762 RepID=UPI001C2FB3A3|nr:HAMP domain-containing sensor histidine kinase [Cohnella sp. GbtcB17]